MEGLFRNLRPEKKPEFPSSAPVSGASSSTCSSCNTSTNSVPPDDLMLHKVFALFDTNGDGKISMGELEAMVLALGSLTREKTNSVVADSDEDVKAETAAVMEIADLDGDGFLDFHELAAYVDAPKESREVCEIDGREEKDLRLAFAVYDCNGDGVITAEELHHVIGRVLPDIGGYRHTMNDCNDMIKAVDKNGDGVISFIEFAAMMNQLNRVVVD